MIIRKITKISLILMLSLSIFVAGTPPVDCCDKFLVVSFNQDVQLKNASMLSPIRHCFEFPAKCYDVDKCTDFCMPTDFISNVTAIDHYSETPTAISMDELLENPADMMLGKQYRIEHRSPATSIFLQTVSFLC
jgi:hypothetical protein